MDSKKQRYPLARGTRGMFELFPEIWQTPHLVFLDENGRIRAACYFGEHDFDAFDLGLVPDDVAGEGADVIRVYGEKLMLELIEKEKRRSTEAGERVSSLRREFELMHEGVRIRGVLTKGPDNGRLRLVMTEPFELEDLPYVRPQCWADSVGGRRTFDDDGDLLKQEIARTQKTLVRMYSDEVRRQNKTPAHPALADLPRHRFLGDDEE